MQQMNLSPFCLAPRWLSIDCAQFVQSPSYLSGVTLYAGHIDVISAVCVPHSDGVASCENE